MNKFVKAIGLIAVFILPFCVQAQQSPLRAQIIELSKPAKGIVGVSVLGLEDRDTVNVHSTAKLVMHSVIKLPIAMAVLHLVDSGLFTLDKTIKIKKKDLDTLYSPLRDKFPMAATLRCAICSVTWFRKAITMPPMQCSTFWAAPTRWIITCTR